jgi:riboflavin kinase/FMN adenylyltransferase
MRVISDNRFQPISGSSVVTIGNFDGVHLGHRALIDRCIERVESGQESAVVTFEPLPQTFFSPDNAPARLSSRQQKLEWLEQSGIDLVWMMGFNQELAGMTAAGFAESVLSKSLSARRVVVGKDFRFGRAREGDLDTLSALGRRFGYEVEAVSDVEIDGAKVSSSAIRVALAAGDFQLASTYLGRSFTMQGEVIQGSRLGRKLGYPTANMRPEAIPSPVAGVYAVQVRKQGEKQWLDAVASLGNRPVVRGKEFLVEVHIFDFSQDLYGQRLEVRFEEKIRDEQNFAEVKDLVEQMKKDEARARDVLQAAAHSQQK